MRKITNLSIRCKWETLKNWQCIKNLFVPLYVVKMFLKMQRHTIYKMYFRFVCILTHALCITSIVK